MSDPEGSKGYQELHQVCSSIKAAEVQDTPANILGDLIAYKAQLT